MMTIFKNFRFRSISVLIIFTSIISLHCGNKSGLLIDRALPKSEMAGAKKGDIIISTSTIEDRPEGRIIVYSYWKFLSGTQGKINLRYEEFYSNIKEKPDLSDDLSLEIKNDIAETGNFKIHIYKLSADDMIFQVSSK